MSRATPQQMSSSVLISRWDISVLTDKFKEGEGSKSGFGFILALSCSVAGPGPGVSALDAHPVSFPNRVFLFFPFHVSFFVWFWILSAQANRARGVIITL